MGENCSFKGNSNEVHEGGMKFEIGLEKDIVVSHVLLYEMKKV